LSKLIVMYDDNGISIDGEVEHWFADNTPKRFEAYGWNVIPNVNGHDVDAVDAAIAKAKQNAALDKGPTLICCKTNIGEGSPNLAGTDKVHGAPLGDAEIAATRAAIGWEYAPFEIPAEVYNAWDAQVEGAARQSAWDKLFDAYGAKFPAKAAEFKRRMAGDLPAQFEQTAARLLAEVASKGETIATRKASQNAITLLAAELPELLGGSADLTGSNLTNWPKCVAVRRNKEGFTAGNHINWGVREFGMSAALNGVALHGGYIPFGATFLTFSDYSRNALRMAALMKKRNIFVFTHDSIGLGEDGPTHQPVEHAATLRLLPNMDVWRPADSVESMAAWNSAVMRKDGPSALLFSRQNLPFLARSESVLNSIAKGGYVLADAANAKVTLIATGSEIEIAMNTQKALAEKGVAARVVSMPSTNVFDRQSADYKIEVLGTAPIAVIEAGMTDGWYKYIAQAGVKGTVLGMNTFGESAPAGALFKHFGLTTEKFTEAALALVAA
jgi:transketolase